jgi:hypothetical protein
MSAEMLKDIKAHSEAKGHASDDKIERDENVDVRASHLELEKLELS